MGLPANKRDICFGHRARAASRAVSRAFNESLRPVNLQITQLALLVTLSCSEASTAVLAETLGVEDSAMLRNLATLERRGLVTSTGGRGRRGRRAALTPAGRALLLAAVPLWSAVQADLDRELGDAADGVRAALTTLEAAAVRLSGTPQGQ
jgi:DNA-binding MarR family transcriptional regulator